MLRVFAGVVVASAIAAGAVYATEGFTETPQFLVAEDSPTARADRTTRECDDNYSGACIPVVGYDLDCGDVPSGFRVVGGDPHGFDRDNDNRACE